MGRGEAVQVDSIKPMLKTPGTILYKLLKLRYDEPLSNFGFNINLRRYIEWLEPKQMTKKTAEHRGAGKGEKAAGDGGAGGGKSHKAKAPAEEPKAKRPKGEGGDGGGGGGDKDKDKPAAAAAAATAAAAKSGKANVSKPGKSEEPEEPEAVPEEMRLHVNLSTALKRELITGWERITRENKLVALPRAAGAFTCPRLSST